MKEIILATRNDGKLREFKNTFATIGITICGLDEMPGAPAIDETGATFADNALLKAEGVARWCAKPVMADDSGIIIDALPQEFGVHSARQVGERSYADVNSDIVQRLEGKRGDERAARYKVALAFVDLSTGRKEIVEATFEGFIHTEIAGCDGFGFDPIFYLPAYGKTVAEIPLNEKAAISHRGKAIAMMKKKLGLPLRR